MRFYYFLKIFDYLREYIRNVSIIHFRQRWNGAISLRELRISKNESNQVML